MADIKCEIVKELGVLSESAKGWKKEVNLVSWNGKKPKYDLRDWAPGHEKMGSCILIKMRWKPSLAIRLNGNELTTQSIRESASIFRTSALPMRTTGR